MEFLTGWERGDYLSLAEIVASAFIALGIYFLQKRLSDKQKLDHRLEIEKLAERKLIEMSNKKRSHKINLYNSKLLNKKYFSLNKRSRIWGYPYHAAEFYSINFDGLEFIVNIEEWKGKKFYKVGLIPFNKILGIKPEGDGSFNGFIFFVKPKFLQKDKYAIAYTAYRYYPVDVVFSSKVRKPFGKTITDWAINLFRWFKSSFYYRWKK